MSNQEFCTPVWSEGMFLAPQHLQFLAHHEMAMRWASTQHHAPYSWGFKGLELDEQSLAANDFKMLNCEAILPGGAVMILPGNLVVPSRSFKEHAQSLTSGLMVHLGVPEIKLGQVNLLRSEEDGQMLESPRFKVSELELADMNTGEESRKIEVAKVRGRLFFGDEERQGYQCLPLARLLPAPGGEGAVLDQTYIPPAIKVEAWDPLGNLIQDLTSRVMATYATLLKDFAGKEIAEILSLPQGHEATTKIQALGGQAMVLNHLVNTPNLHPYQFYLELLRLVGSLMIFSGGQEIKTPPPYRHENQGECFNGLAAILGTLLDRLAAPAFIRRGFILRNDRLEVDLESDWVTGRRQLYVGVGGDDEPESMSRKVAGLKLCAPRDLNTVIQRRLGAIPIRWLRMPPSALPANLDGILGQITPGGSLWSGVQDDLVLVLSGAEGLHYRFDLYVV